MNKVYKVIYSKAKACYVVASEFAKRDGKCSTDKRQSSRQTMKLAAALVAFLVSIGGGTINFVQAADASVKAAPAQTITKQVDKDGKVTVDTTEVGGPIVTVEDIQQKSELEKAGIIPGNVNGADNSIALGSGSNAYKSNSTAIGNGAKSGKLGIAIGQDAGKASTGREGAITVGAQSDTKGLYSVVVGTKSHLTSDDKQKVFTKDVQGAAATVIGSFNNLSTKATEGKAFASVGNTIFGAGNKTEDSNGVIIQGVGNTVTNSYKNIDLDFWDALNIAGGDFSALTDKETGSIAVIGGANTIDSSHIVSNIGFGNTITGSEGVFVVGQKNTLKNTKDSLIMGNNVSLDGIKGAISLGDKNEISGDNAVVIGNGNKVIKAGGSLALGTNASVDMSNLSFTAPATGGWNGIAIGTDTVVKDSANGIAIGASADATNSNHSIAIGEGSSASGVSEAENSKFSSISQNNTAIGQNAGVIASTYSNSEDSTAIGANVKLRGSSKSIALGSGANITNGYQSIAIGNTSAVEEGGFNGTALGASSIVKGGIVDSVALGSNSIAMENNVISVGSSKADVKKYNAYVDEYNATMAKRYPGETDRLLKKIDENSISDFTRRITNVADGTADTDAATVGQLKKKADVSENGYVEYSDKDKNSVTFGGGEKGTSLNNVGDIVMKVPYQDRANGYKTVYKERSFQKAGLMPGEVVFDDNFKEDGGNSIVKGNVVAIGGNTKSTNSSGATVLGAFGSIENSNFATALGTGTTITDSTESTAIGNNANVFHADWSTAIGKNASVTGIYDSTTKKYVNVRENTAIGQFAGVDGANSSVALGAYSKVAQGQDNVVSVGNATNSLYRKIINVADGDIAIGSHDAVTGGQLAASGIIAGTTKNDQNPGSYQTALGNGSVVNAEKGTALGSYAKVEQGASESVALGTGSVAGWGDVLSADGKQDPRGVISVGKSGQDGFTRRIVNVKAGVNETDAVNYGQLKEVSDVANAGFTVAFAQPDGSVQTKAIKPHDTVTVTSNNDNILAKVDDKGQVNVSLNDDLKVNSIASKNGQSKLNLTDTGLALGYGDHNIAVDKNGTKVNGHLEVATAKGTQLDVTGDTVTASGVKLQNGTINASVKADMFGDTQNLTFDGNGLKVGAVDGFSGNDKGSTIVKGSSVTTTDSYGNKTTIDGGSVMTEILKVQPDTKNSLEFKAGGLNINVTDPNGGINAYTTNANVGKDGVSLSVDNGSGHNSSAKLTKDGTVFSYSETGATGATTTTIKGNTITAGDVVINGTKESATVTGLSNTKWDADSVKADRAATEGQLQSMKADIDANSYKGWKVSVNGGEATDVASNATVDFANTDGNISLSQDGTNIKVDLKDDVAIKKSLSAADGKFKVDEKGNVLANNGTSALQVNDKVASLAYGNNTIIASDTGVELNGAGNHMALSYDGAKFWDNQNNATTIKGNTITTGSITAGNIKINDSSKITGIANGDISENSTDAVNGSQLYKVQTLAGKHTSLTLKKEEQNLELVNTSKDDQKNDYVLSLKKDLTVDSITAGTNVFNTTGLTIGTLKLTNGSVTGLNNTTFDVTKYDSYKGSSNAATEGQLHDAFSFLDSKIDNISIKGDGNVVVDPNGKGNNGSGTTEGGTTPEGGTTTKPADSPSWNIGLNKDNITLGDKKNNVTIEGTKGNITTTGTVKAGDTSISSNGVQVGDEKAGSSLKADSLTVGGKEYISKDGINANNQTVTNVADGAVKEDSKDAVNGGQLWSEQQARIDADNAISTQLGSLGTTVNKLDRRVDQVGAGAAALAALHPLDYDPLNKWDFAAGYGNYRGASAVAVGTYYRPNENTMVSVGGSFGSGENMVNAGVSFKFGDGRHDSVGTSRAAMAKTIDDLKSDNKSLADTVATQGKQIKALEEKLQKLLDAQSTDKKDAPKAEEKAAPATDNK